MFAYILVFWIVGVPAAVLTATELGARLRDRKRGLRPTSIPVLGYQQSTAGRGRPSIRVRGDSACRESF